MGIIGDEACPSCQSIGRDKTSNHLILFEDGGKHCQKCKYTVLKSGIVKNSGHLGGESVSQRQPLPSDECNLAKPLVQIDPTSLSSKEFRGIRKDIRAKYKVTTECSTSDGQPIAQYYPIHVGGKLFTHKKRILPKTFVCLDKTKGQKVEFFGQQACPGGKRLLIVEGEEDAQAGFQMLEKWKVAVVSLPTGANLSCFADNMSYLRGFKEITINLDGDKVGQEVTEKIAKLMPDVKLMSIPLKDACDMLDAGKEKEFQDGFWAAKVYVPTSILSVDDVFDEATSMPEWGRPWPWPALTNLTYGRRDGEGMYVGAGVKIGKSEFVNELIRHIIEVDKLKPAIFKFEEAPGMTVRKIAGKFAGKMFHKPDAKFTQKELVDEVGKLKGTMILYKSFSTPSWDELKDDIRYVVLVEGCKDVIIDPLTRLTNHLDPSQTETELRRISHELSTMAHDLGFTYYVFCHLKAPSDGRTPHERGGVVLSSQFRGSRAMMENCHYMLGIERNKDPKLDADKRNTSTFVLLEDRVFGNVGKFPVFYDVDDGSYLEPKIKGGF